MNALIIAANGLKRILHDRSALFWIFVGPVIMVAFFGVLLKPQPERPTQLLLLNRDSDDYVARVLTAILTADKVEVARIQTAPAGRWTLEIPPHTAEAMAANQPAKAILHAGAEETSAERDLRFKIQKALVTIYLRANPADAGAWGPRSQEKLAERLAGEDQITIARPNIGVEKREVTAGFQRSVPSYVVMFVFLNLLVSGAGIAEERASGKLRRVFVAPVSKHAIVLGKLLSRTVVGWIQIVYLLALGVFLFHIKWAAHPGVLFGFLTLFALASAALGMLLGTLFKQPDKCAAAAVWTAVLLAPLGGLWWPLELVGPTMRKVGYFVPTGWAMESVNAMLAFGAGAQEVAPFAAALAGLFVASLWLTVRRLKPS